MDTIRDLIAAVHVYLREQKSPDTLLLNNIARYVTQIFQIFGVIPSGNVIGFPSGLNDVNVSFKKKETLTLKFFCLQREELVMPYLTILSEFRQAIRTHAKEIKATTILEECDRLRDQILPEVGVRMEDLDNAAAAVKLVDRDELIKERNEKKRIEAEKALEKEQKRAAAAAKAAQTDAQKRIKPEEMFRAETSKYSQFDENVSGGLFNIGSL